MRRVRRSSRLHSPSQFNREHSPQFAISKPARRQSRGDLPLNAQCWVAMGSSFSTTKGLRAGPNSCSLLSALADIVDRHPGRAARRRTSRDLLIALSTVVRDSRFKPRILSWSVERLTPKRAAAPFGPATTIRVFQGAQNLIPLRPSSISEGSWEADLVQDHRNWRKLPSG